MTESVVPATGADAVPPADTDAPTVGEAGPDRTTGAEADENAATDGSPDNGPLAELATTQAHLVERVEDLARILARQAAGVERLADDAKARDRRERQGADLPLVTELFALLGTTSTCADTAESDREREAFEAIATRVERLLVGRGGILVRPAPGDAFDSLSMEAADVVTTDDPEADRTVDAVLQAGLSVPGRSVRPARVVVRRHR